MKMNKFALAAVAVSAALSLSVGTALAYFTDSVTATGSGTLQLGGGTTITEEFEAGTKIITIAADPGSVPMWVRARAYAADGITTSVYDDNENKDWNGQIGWVYAQKPIDGVDGGYENETPPLYVEITNFPEPGSDLLTFEVVVVYESAPVRFDEDGNPIAPDDADNWIRTVEPVEGRVEQK